jgi:hypothetical protein
LVEKIPTEDALHDVEIAPGNLVCVSVDWTLASEASWMGMYCLYNTMSKSGIHRNDRFWLAADHVVSDGRFAVFPAVNADGSYRSALYVHKDVGRFLPGSLGSGVDIQNHQQHSS